MIILMVLYYAHRQQSVTMTFYADFWDKRNVQKLNPGQDSWAIKEVFFLVGTWHQEHYYQFSFF
jgi:hypothetical protein